MPNRNNSSWPDYVIKILFICALAFFSYSIYKSKGVETTVATAPVPAPTVLSAEPEPTAAPPSPTTRSKPPEPIIVVEPTFVVIEIEKEVTVRPDPVTPTPSENHTFSFSVTLDSSLIEKAADSAIKGFQSIDFKKIGEKISDAIKK